MPTNKLVSPHQTSAEFVQKIWQVRTTVTTRPGNVRETINQEIGLKSIYMSSLQFKTVKEYILF